ncbi:hypothetical protein PG991_000699 [Apiospora marii]|uniref:Uncharacterized protein n=1 Tax=Apiospora marii TaxID=335849 RepID=A0ABR1SV16_9PEZI
MEQLRPITETTSLEPDPGEKRSMNREHQNTPLVSGPRAAPEHLSVLLDDDIEYPTYGSPRFMFAHLGDLLIYQNDTDHGSHQGIDSIHDCAELHRYIRNHNVQSLLKLLNVGADMEFKDENGETPLYLATRLGFQDMIKLLLEKGADPESINPNLPNLPSALFQALLQYGAEKGATDSNGETIESLAKGSQEIELLLQAPPLLQGPHTSAVHATEPRRNQTQPQESPPYNDRDQMISLHNFMVVMVDFFLVENSERRMMKSLSMFDLLYGDETLREAMQWGALSGSKPDFRWYHLPENNIGPDGKETKQENLVAFMPYLHHENQPNQHALYKEIKELLKQSPQDRVGLDEAGSTVQHEHQHMAADPAKWPIDGPGLIYRHLIKRYLNVSPDDEDMHLQLRRTLDQYLSPEIDTTGRDQDQVVYRYMKDRYKEPRLFMVDQLWFWIINGDTLITCASNGLEPRANITPAVRPAVPEQTPNLAQAYLNFMNISYRPRQRPTRRRTRRWAEDQVHNWQSMDQLPEAYSRHQTTEGSVDLSDHVMNVHRNIINHLQLQMRAPIKSAYELAVLISNHCAAAFDPSRTPERFQFFDFFERSITRVSGEASELLQQFRNATGRSKETHMHEQLNIRREFDLLTETEDIQEELGILRKVLVDEKEVKDKLWEVCNKLGHNTRQYVHDGGRMFKEMDQIGHHLRRIELMEKMVSRINKMVNIPPADLKALVIKC